MKIAITGATGYIGSHLLELLQKYQYSVLALSRKKPLWPVSWQEYHLSQRSIELPSDVNCVVHLAMNVSLSSSAEMEREIEAASMLIAAAQKINSMFIYVSSQTSSDAAITWYGKAKWAVEKSVLAAGGIVVRPGMVYGGKAAGLYGSMLESLSRLPVIPKIIPAPLVQPIHVMDLCEGIRRLSESDYSGKIFSLAAKKATSFDNFLAAIVKYRLKRQYFIIPIPRVLISFLAIVFPKNSQVIRLQSLVNLPLMDTKADIDLLDLRLRLLQDGFYFSIDPERRKILKEGRAFLTYLLKNHPSIDLLKRYCRVIKSLRNNSAIDMPVQLCKYPFLIGYINANAINSFAWGAEFKIRLDIATLIAEASTQGAKRFLRIDKNSSFLISALICSFAVLKEISNRLCGVFLQPIIKRSLIHMDNQKNEY